MRKLSEDERRGFQESVKRIYGVENYLDEYVLVKAGDGRVRVCTAEAFETASILRKVVSVGVYAAKWRDWGVVLTIEGSNLLKSRPPNVFELERDEALMWMDGAPLRLEGWKGEKIVLGSFHGFLLGAALVGRDGIAYPQIPKWRRIHGE